MCFKVKGSSEDGTTSHGEGKKGKRDLMAKAKNWNKKRREKKSPDAQFKSLELDGFTRSQGFIFKAQFQVSNLPCDIPKWKSEYYITSHDSLIFTGNIPYTRLRAKDTAPVDVIIQVPLEAMKKWLTEIQNTITGGVIKIRFELDLTLSLCVIGEHQLPRISYDYEMKVSEFLDKLLSETLPEKSYPIGRLVLDLYDGKEVSEVVDGLSKEILTPDGYTIVHLATKLALGKEDFSPVLKEFLKAISDNHPDFPQGLISAINFFL